MVKVAQCQLIFTICFFRSLFASQDGKEIGRFRVAVHVFLQQGHCFRCQRHGQGTACFAAAVSNHISLQIILAEIGQIDKRQSAKQKHQDKPIACFLHHRRDAGLGQPGEYFSHIFTIQRTLAVGTCTRIDRSEQMRYIHSFPPVYGTVVNCPQRSEIRRHRVPTASAFAQTDFKTFHPFGRQLTEH